MVDIVKVHNGDDWEALYIDGEKVASQHLGRIEVGRELVGYTVDSYRKVEQPMATGMNDEPLWEGYQDVYPDKLEDVPNA